MADEIVNRVANSKLVTIDLEALYPHGERWPLDISQWLHEGLVLREKEFRSFVEAHNWETYKNGYLHMFCSTEAIVPVWAYMLCATKAAFFCNKVVVGSREDLDSILFCEIIQSMDVSEYTDKPVIVKGCSGKPVPESAYILLTQRLQGVARSIMYGEACSSVPLYKRK